MQDGPTGPAPNSSTTNSNLAFDRLFASSDVTAIYDQRPQVTASIGDEDTQCACDTCFDSDFCDEVYPGMDEVPDISRLHSHWSSTEFDATNSWFAHFKTGIIKKDSMSKKTTVICLREE